MPAKPTRRPAAVAPARQTGPKSAPGECELLVAQVQQLANAGRLPEARVAGERCVREHGPSVAVHCLLGLIYDASGDATAAAAHYRKALYLDPQHVDSLRHLAYLLDKQGNAPAAQVLRDRLLRAEATPG